jgi:hypothetical protein
MTNRTDSQSAPTPLKYHASSMAPSRHPLPGDDGGPSSEHFTCEYFTSECVTFANTGRSVLYEFCRFQRNTALLKHLIYCTFWAVRRLCSWPGQMMANAESGTAAVVRKITIWLRGLGGSLQPKLSILNALLGTEPAPESGRARQPVKCVISFSCLAPPQGRA